MNKYVFKLPMSVDEACRDFYGKEGGTVEAVLDANPGASARPAIKPAGFSLVMPVINPKEEVKTVVALWS